MPESQRQVHNRLAVLRAERGLSRKQLADKLGINYQTIGYIERGDYNPSLELALAFAEFFRLPVEAIFSLKPMTPLSAEVFRELTADDR
jgi:DNA-binding XRE family transcriptional regulator